MEDYWFTDMLNSANIPLHQSNSMFNNFRNPVFKDFDILFDDFNDLDIPFDDFNNFENSDNVQHNSVIFQKFFSKQFIVNNINFSENIDRSQLLKYESSDKVILPRSALNVFASYSKDKIYTLRLMNPKNSKYSFVGIGDFTSPERIIYVPTWLMEYLCLKDGDHIYVDAISVPKITYAKIKIPDSLKTLLDNKKNNITNTLNIKVVIEYILHNHCLLFLGKKLGIKIFEKQWDFEVVELKPINVGNIIDTDVQLDLV